MTRTFGHGDSQHTYWKHHWHHSSNKLNKIDMHKRIRNEIKNLVAKFGCDIDSTDIPKHDSRFKNGKVY